MRSRTRSAFSTPPLNSTCVGQASPLGPRRTSPCSAVAACWRRKRAMCRVIGGIGGIGQPEFLQARRGAGRRASRCCRPAGRKPSPSTCSMSVAQQRRLDRAADQARAFAENRDRLLPWPSNRARAAFPWRRGSWPRAAWCCRLSMRVPFSREPLRHHAGEREIDVVAAEQDVLADRDAAQRQFAVALGDGDQGEIGGAAADIDDQDEVADAGRARASRDGARSRRRRRPAALRAA